MVISHTLWKLIDDERVFDHDDDDDDDDDDDGGGGGGGGGDDDDDDDVDKEESYYFHVFVNKFHKFNMMKFNSNNEEKKFNHWMALRQTQNVGNKTHAPHSLDDWTQTIHG